MLLPCLVPAGSTGCSVTGLAVAGLCQLTARAALASRSGRAMTQLGQAAAGAPGPYS